MPETEDFDALIVYQTSFASLSQCRVTHMELHLEQPEHGNSGKLERKFALLHYEEREDFCHCFSQRAETFPVFWCPTCCVDVTCPHCCSTSSIGMEGLSASLSEPNPGVSHFWELLSEVDISLLFVSGDKSSGELLQAPHSILLISKNKLLYSGIIAANSVEETLPCEG